MITRLIDVEGIQGPMIRRLLKHAGPITLEVYRRAHVAYLKTQPGRPVTHDAGVPLVMKIAGGQWLSVCPECSSGIATGQGWPEARCFRCGALFTDVRWPEDRASIEKLVLARPLKYQHWTPEETLGELEADNETLRSRGIRCR